MPKEFESYGAGRARLASAKAFDTDALDKWQEQQAAKQHRKRAARAAKSDITRIRSTKPRVANMGPEGVKTTALGRRLTPVEQAKAARKAAEVAKGRPGAVTRIPNDLRSQDPYAAARRMETEFAKSKGKDVAAHLKKSGIPPLAPGSGGAGGKGATTGGDIGRGFESARTPAQAKIERKMATEEVNKEIRARAKFKAERKLSGISDEFTDALRKTESGQEKPPETKAKRVMSEKQKASLAKAHDAVRAKHKERKERAAAMGGVGGGGGMGGGGEQARVPAGGPKGGQFSSKG